MRVAIAVVLAPRSALPVSQDARALLLRPDAPEFSAPAPAVSIGPPRDLEGHRRHRGDARVGAARRRSLRRPRCATAITTRRASSASRTGRWAQFGINGDPAIAKAWRTRTIPDDPFKQSNVRGTVAFAFARAERTDDAGLHQPAGQLADA